MDDTKRTLSWPAIIGIFVAAIATSLAASYLVQRFLLDKPNPDHKVSVLVAVTVPLWFLISRRRKSS